MIVKSDSVLQSAKLIAETSDTVHVNREAIKVQAHMVAGYNKFITIYCVKDYGKDGEGR